MTRMQTGLTAIVVVVLMGGGFAIHRINEARELDEGVVAYKRGDYQRALQILDPLAKKGNGTAQELIGLAYAFGHGVRKDRHVAREMLVAAAPQKLGETFLFVAEEFEDGKNVGRDAQEARYWLEAAADAGSEKAKGRIAAMKK